MCGGDLLRITRVTEHTRHRIEQPDMTIVVLDWMTPLSSGEFFDKKGAAHSLVTNATERIDFADVVENFIPCKIFAWKIVD